MILNPNEVDVERVKDKLLCSTGHRNESAFIDKADVYKVRNPFEIASQFDCVVEIPDNFTLQLDLDTEDQFNEFKINLRDIEKRGALYFDTFEVRVSKSGLPHRHVILKSKTEMHPWQRLALQFMLKSDPKREFLNGLRILLNDPVPIALFTKSQIDH